MKRKTNNNMPINIPTKKRKLNNSLIKLNNIYTIPKKINVELKLITYNIFSSELSNINFYPECDPDYLDKDYRINLIIKDIEYFIKNNYIICLQEVCVYYRKIISKIFELNNYNFVFSQYKHNLGVLIAYPNTYNYIHHESIKINSLVLFNNSKVLNKFSNEILILILEINNIQFIVSTCHLPCIYQYPNLQKLCVYHYFKLIQSYNLPYIIAGDFNFTKKSDIYINLVYNIIDLNVNQIYNEYYMHKVRKFNYKTYKRRNGFHYRYKKLNWKNAQKNETEKVIHFDNNYNAYSINKLNKINYLKLNKNEYTTRTKTKNNDNIFQEILDYVFTSNNIDFLKTYVHKNGEIGNDLLPNKYNGSDHLPVVCHLQLTL